MLSGLMLLDLLMKAVGQPSSRCSLTLFFSFQFFQLFKFYKPCWPFIGYHLEFFFLWKFFDTIFPHVVLVLELFPPMNSFILLSKNLKYCGNYLNWLQFPNSKKNSFYGNNWSICWISQIPNMNTVKLGFKERFDKEQIGIKEPFTVTNLPFT